MKSDTNNPTDTYDRLHTQVTNLMEALRAAIDGHAQNGRDYPDELLRLRQRLVGALAEISQIDDDDVEDLIGE